MAERLADEVELDLQVLVDELPGLLPVGEDAADLGGRDDDRVGPLLREEPAGRGLVGEVQLVQLARDERRVAGLAERAMDRAADEAGVAGEVDARASVERRAHNGSLSAHRRQALRPACPRALRPACPRSLLPLLVVLDVHEPRRLPVQGPYCTPRMRRSSVSRRAIMLRCGSVRAASRSSSYLSGVIRTAVM